jgi:hypothetical protein
MPALADKAGDIALALGCKLGRQAPSNSEAVVSLKQRLENRREWLPLEPTRKACSSECALQVPVRLRIVGRGSEGRDAVRIRDWS